MRIVAVIFFMITVTCGPDHTDSLDTIKHFIGGLSIVYLIDFMCKYKFFDDDEN